MGALHTYECKLEVALGVRGVVVDGLEVLDGADAGLAVQEVVHLDVQAGQRGAHAVAVVPAAKLPPVRCIAQHILLAPFLADIVAAAHHDLKARGESSESWRKCSCWRAHAAQPSTLLNAWKGCKLASHARVWGAAWHPLGS